MNIVTFLRGVYSDNQQRVERRRSLSNDIYLYALNRAVQPLERRLLARQEGPHHPIVFILGVPRSGTTLLYQLIARLFAVGYISNAVARYWMAPLYASIRHRGPIAASRAAMELSSNLGATSGPSAPHEFSYFWHFWSGFFQSDDLTERELATIKWGAIRRELLGLSRWWRAPLVLKALTHINYNLDHAYNQIPGARFILIERDERFVVQSILKARAQRYGTETYWWSLRPRDVSHWLHRTPVEQIVHQVHDVARGLTTGLAHVPSHAVHRTSYERLICNTEAELAALARFLGCAAPSQRQLRTLRLDNGNVWRVDHNRALEIEQLLERDTASGS